MTRLESIIAILVGMVAVISSILGAAWKVKGWVDNVAETDRYLAQYIVKLDDTLKLAHQENQRRFTSLETNQRRIEQKLDRKRGQVV